ncbi:MAG: hypothetical protein FJY76_04055 [Candidatus Aenigmarchaeota archaeon]|nr:hypothetical protein [Candidatus Aenigmarchaeota archaeon]
MENMKTICIIGAGRVGASAAFALVLKGFRNIHLYDIDQKRAQGEAMDLCDVAGEAGAVEAWDELKKADIYVMAAGRPRTADMSRLDLLEFNAKISEPVFRRIAELNPAAHVIVATNPSDEIADIAKKYLKNIVVSAFINDSKRARIVFGRPIRLAGTHSNRQFEGLTKEEEKLVSKYNGRAAEIISLKGCTQWGVASEIAELVGKLVKRK